MYAASFTGRFNMREGTRTPNANRPRCGALLIGDDSSGRDGGAVAPEAQPPLAAIVAAIDFACARVLTRPQVRMTSLTHAISGRQQ